MGYIALYRKYRPQVFEDVVEQETVVKILQEALRQKKIAHAYLFAGPKGTGKTSIARIFAKGLNCEEGPTPHPCMKCQQCVTITNGTNLDVIEIDAASNRGIDEIRDLKEKVQYAPVSARYKVYIIDEAHMLTMQAFNALLKTLEEPPENVVFILATTEPEKIPATIISRCERFYFKPISIKGLFNKIVDVAKKENVKITDSAAFLIARFSSGSLRNALSLLDQAVTMFTEITEEKIRELIGIPGDDLLKELFDSIIAKNPERALSVVKRMEDSGKDSKVFVGEFLNYLQDLLNVKIIGESAEGSFIDENFKKILREQSKRTSIKQIVNTSFAFSEALNSIKLFPDPFFAIQLTALKCMDLDVISSERNTANLSNNVAETVPSVSEVSVKKSPNLSNTFAEGEREASETAKAGEEVDKQPVKEAPTNSLDFVLSHWDSVLAEIGNIDKPLLAMFERVHPVKFDNGLLTLMPEKEFYLHMLKTEDKLRIVEDALKKVFHKDIKIKYEAGEKTKKSPTTIRDNKPSTSEVEEIKKNENVNEILTLFDGTITEVKKIDEEDKSEKH
jgi:DNA polymerase-3 subunit gamma/tau